MGEHSHVIVSCAWDRSGHQRDELVMLLGAANLDTCKRRANYASSQVSDFVEFSFDKSAGLQKTGSVYGFQNRIIPFLGLNCSLAWEDSLGHRDSGSRTTRLTNSEQQRTVTICDKGSLHVSLLSMA